MSLRILQGDWIEMLKTLPDQSVHCCVSSPPYWGLRKYIADDASEKKFELGLERTPEEYLSKLIAGFDEVRRVLRDDGTLWLNMGDVFCSQGGPEPAQTKWQVDGASVGQNGGKSRCGVPGLKAKDLLGLPWMVAFALRAAGWYLRCDIIWHKPNPMPESVNDRPTRAHEYIFLLSKKPRYYYDAFAVQEAVTGGAHPPGKRTGEAAKHAASPNGFIRDKQNFDVLPAARNKRSVWTVASDPFKGAHFATFPDALILPCILAGTSAKGCCPKCGAPWIRTLEKPQVPHSAYDGKYADEANRGRNLQRALKTARANGGEHDNPFPSTRTTGWEPTCKCGCPDTVPCTVCDPFAGTLTTCQVALDNGRNAIGIELNPEYIALGRDRCGLFGVDQVTAGH